MTKLNETVENFFTSFTKPIKLRMDAKVKKTCPCCSQHYSLSCPKQPKGRVPLLQKCGHSCCEVCLRNMINFAEPIVCKVCQRETEVPSKIATNDFYDLFPMNIYMLGELAVQVMDTRDANIIQEDYYINLKEILAAAESSKGICVECKAPTTKLCQECDTILCESCFRKIHTFHIFKSHVLTNLEAIMEPSFCALHPEKQLDYYCRDCDKTVCMDCMIVGGEHSCKNHDVIPVKEVNETVIVKLNDLAPKVDETYRRLTKTAVEIGHLLKNIRSDVGDSELDKLKSEVYQHFSKLLAAIQTHLHETMDIMNNLKNIEEKSLTEARSSVEQSIKKAVDVLKKTTVAMNSSSRNKANLSAILDEAKQVINAPWCLRKEVKKQDPLKIAVNEDLCALVSDYVHLEGNAAPAYLLLPAEQAGEPLPPAPPAPVLPPELLKDVRDSFQKNEVAKPKEGFHKPSVPTPFLTSAPKYRSKSGSNSSLNSLGSDHSDGRSIVSGYSRYESFAPVVPVLPYAESNHPKPLVEGSQELVYISHIFSPEHFYVQRASHQKEVKEMIREFRSAGSLPKPTLTHLAEGKIYLAFNSTDNEWQRGRVLSVERGGAKPACEVFYIDFGSTEVVSVDKLRLLPAARLRSPPPLAARCSLHNCAPRYGSWDADDALLVQRIVDNKKALLHVRRGPRGPGGPGGPGGALAADLTTVEDGVSLLHALLFHERAKLLNPHLTYPQFMSLSDRPKLLFSSNDFKMKVPEDVVITHVVSPDNFYVRRCHFRDTFDKLCEELNNFYSLGVTTGSIYCPEVGMFCVVSVEGAGAGGAGAGAGGWRRAVVSELPGRLRVRVSLPDSGESALVHHTMLRKIQPEFAKQKALATECHLSGITPQNRRWNPNSVALLRQYALRPLSLVLAEAPGRGRGGSLPVELYDGEECLNALMVRHKFAVSIGLFTFNKHQPIEDQAYTIKTPHKKKIANPGPKQKLTILKRDALLPSPIINEEELEAMDKGPFKIEVQVISCQSPSVLYVSLVNQQQFYKTLYDALQEHYTDNKLEGKKDWSVGEKCCTVCIETGTWRRALIIKLENENATVFFTDFATVNTVPITALRELYPDYGSIAECAIKCHLIGIVPALGGEWPSLTKEFLRERLDEYQRIFLTKKGTVKDGSLPVEVWVYHVTHGSALEPDRADWRCLNKMIIDQGLAIPDKEMELTTDEDNTDVNDMISIFNITGSVRDWLLLENRNRTAATSSPPAPGAGEEEEEEEKEEEGMNTKFVSDWLPPEPLATREFVAVPTYVDGDGHMFLHDVAQRGTLELVRNALDVRFRSSAAARRRSWAAGQPCVAKFYLDDRFYRGRVLEADKETALVHYVDYGNEERCALQNMRRDIVLHEIPTQAHKCRLARIRPKSAGWDKATLDYIHRSVVEKQCLVRIVGDAVDGAIPIELKFDKLWLNDHLVDFELALYTDGKKPVVSKYVPAPPASDKSIDSGPNYIVDDQESAPSTNATVTNPIKDWNEILEADFDDSFTTYPDNNTGEQFICSILCIGAQDLVFELSVVHNDETNLIYEEMFAELQEKGAASPPIDGVFEHKACLARYHEDGRWYRAAILQYNEPTQTVKVKYVDYGNYEIISLSDAREIRDEWVALPPRALPAKIQGLGLGPDVELQVINQEFEETFLNKGPFHAKVIESGPVSIIELTNEDGSIPYEHLLENGVLVNSD